MGSVPPVFPLYVSQLVVAVHCEGAGVSFVVVPVYAPPHRPLGPILDELNQVFTQYPSSSFVLGGDFNAKHALWDPVSGDERGAQLVQFACGNNLHILNLPDSLPTFGTPYARPWIDVTLASVSLVGGGYRWSVSDEDTLSHHRYIEFMLRDAASAPEKRLTNYARAQIAAEILSRDPCSHQICRCRFSSAWMLDAAVERFCSTYNTVRKRYARKPRPRSEGAKTWWTPQLTAERSRVRAMRRRYQRVRDPALREVLRSQYAQAFAAYKRSLRRAKDTADHALCSDITSRNLFGRPFQSAFARQRPITCLPPLETSDGALTTSIQASAALLLRTHVAVDDPAADNDFHSRVRAIAGSPPEVPNDHLFTLPEIEHSLLLATCVRRQGSTG
nr:uncharacterized protein LOC126535431 [Dermacentor andersoni]